VREEDDFTDDGEAEFEKCVGDELTIKEGTAKYRGKERKEGVRELIDEPENDSDNQSEDMERWEEYMIKIQWS
jgi:hypothetical protein